jgi:beta-lactamase class A
VTQKIAGHGGRYGIAIKDLSTGLGVLVDPDGEYEAASLFKLAVMYEVFKQRDLGTLSLSESLVLTERHVAYDLGTLDRPAGSSIELREALERMITISDNSSAILLTDRVGALNINRDLQALGLTHTRVLLDDLSTSPGDMLSFFEMLARGQGLSPETSAEMIHLLSRQRVNDRIPHLLPSSAVVAHKTGNLPGVVNDAGIVYAPDASFVIAALVYGTPNEGDAAQVIRDLAAVSYEHFRAASGSGPEVRLPAPAPSATARPTSVEPSVTPSAQATATATRTPLDAASAPTVRVIDSLATPTPTTSAAPASSVGTPLQILNRAATPTVDRTATLRPSPHPTR